MSDKKALCYVCHQPATRTVYVERNGARQTQPLCDTHKPAEGWQVKNEWRLS